MRADVYVRKEIDDSSKNKAENAQNQEEAKVYLPPF
jgi:hypothetical protein